MSANPTEPSANRTEKSVMHVSGVEEASSLLFELSKPWTPGETLKSALNRVAKTVNTVGMKQKILREPLKVGRVEDIWKLEARLVRSEEMDAIRLAAKVAKITSLPKQLTALEETLALVDPEYFGPVLQVLREAARAASSQAHASNAQMGTVAQADGAR